MDNGLIFPYPCERAPGESVILTILKRPYAPSGALDVDAWDLIW
ncbi:hypothetical protein PDTK01_38360 [Phycicoccus sp. DTK01]|jgi:hypothetical protein|nr:hypothetical protein PDTK01_38360 [Phycicoccus sp. DTK01]